MRKLIGGSGAWGEEGYKVRWCPVQEEAGGGGAPGEEDGGRGEMAPWVRKVIVGNGALGEEVDRERLCSG